MYQLDVGNEGCASGRWHFRASSSDPEHQASMVLLTGIYKVVTVPPQVMKLATAASWLPVCVPMGWGVWITLNRLTLLF